MKNLISLVFAGIIGGLITLGGVYLLNSKKSIDKQETVAQAVPISNTHNLNVKAGSAALPFDFVEAAEKAMPSVVHIKAEKSGNASQNRSSSPFDDLFGIPFDGTRKGSGSGVIISTDGYIVTNNHVIEFADKVEVTLFDNRTFLAEIVGRDEQTDLAVLKIDASRLPVLEKADSDRARIGEWVLAVGNPFELNSTVTAGIISAKGRDIDIIRGNTAIESFIQTDAAVNPGNSGGALVDAKGRLLGINTAIATQTGSFSGYSFAIPVNMMTKIVGDIMEFGSYQRGFLGISIQDLDNDYADELGLNITQGVLIEQVIDRGAAQYAGLLPRDVITEVDNQKVKSAPELQELIGRKRVGDTVNLTIYRGREIKEIPVKLKKGS